MTITLTDVKEVEKAIKRVNRDIRDYYWMANHIATDEKVYIQSTEYSVEATLPTGNTVNDSPTYRIFQRNIRIDERKERLIKKVTRLEDAVKKLSDERERFVIEGCMDQMSLSQIGTILGISKQAVYNIKEKAVRTLAFEMYLSA